MFKAFCGNLPYSATDEDLRDWFTDLGFPPLKANVVTNREDGSSRGFGFAEFATKREMDDAAYAANGRDFQNRQIICNEALPKEQSGGQARYASGKR